VRTISGEHTIVGTRAGLSIHSLMCGGRMLVLIKVFSTVFILSTALLADQSRITDKSWMFWFMGASGTILLLWQS